MIGVFYQTQMDNGLLVTHATAQTYAMLNTNNGKGLDYVMYKTGLISKEKFGANTGITAWRLGIARIGGGPVGLGISVLYFGIDTYYPGGWNGVMNDQNNLIQGTQSVIGISNMFYKH